MLSAGFANVECPVHAMYQKAPLNESRTFHTCSAAALACVSVLASRRPTCFPAMKDVEALRWQGTSTGALSVACDGPRNSGHVQRRPWTRHACNTPPTKVVPSSPSVGASTRTHSTMLTLSSSLHVKGLARVCYGWWTKTYKLVAPLLN
jgi:hypothetical protein